MFRLDKDLFPTSIAVGKYKIEHTADEAGADYKSGPVVFIQERT